jgi:hypothetical protein
MDIVKRKNEEERKKKISNNDQSLATAKLKAPLGLHKCSSKATSPRKKQCTTVTYQKI